MLGHNDQEPAGSYPQDTVPLAQQLRLDSASLAERHQGVCAPPTRTLWRINECKVAYLWEAISKKKFACYDKAAWSLLTKQEISAAGSDMNRSPPEPEAKAIVDFQINSNMGLATKNHNDSPSHNSDQPQSVEYLHGNLYDSFLHHHAPR